MTLDVLCVGAATLDSIAMVESMPGADDRVLSEPFATAGGGPAATAAVTLARLGRTVGFCGVVGDDDAGRRVRQSLESEGVDTTWLRTDPTASTAQSMIIVARSTQSRAIVTTQRFTPRAEDVPTDVAAWLHVDQNGYAATRSAMELRPSGARLSVDGGNPIDGLDLGGVDLYAPTLESLTRRYPGEPIESLRDASREGALRVVATAGSSGTWVLTEAGAVLVPAFPIDAVSTMGAGDVFHGALLASLADDLELTAAVTRANAVAALSCRALDGRSAIPDASTTDAFLASSPNLASRLGAPVTATNGEV